MCHALLFATMVSVAAVGNAAAQRAMPATNLAYPVLITGKVGGAGSGFFLNTVEGVYLVTARHVLFNPDTHVLHDAAVDVLYYSRDISVTQPNIVTLDLSALNATGNIKAHVSQDVAVIKILSLAAPSTPTNGTAGDRKMSSLPGVTFKEHVESSVLVGVPMEAVRTFDQVLVGNEVRVFGYPTSLGLKDIPELDVRRPLLREGIVAGVNPQMHSIILDSAVYFGNSGGLVVEIDQQNL
jgi:hypothetical protein